MASTEHNESAGNESYRRMREAAQATYLRELAGRS